MYIFIYIPLQTWLCNCFLIYVSKGFYKTNPPKVLSSHSSFNITFRYVEDNTKTFILKPRRRSVYFLNKGHYTSFSKWVSWDKRNKQRHNTNPTENFQWQINRGTTSKCWINDMRPNVDRNYNQWEEKHNNGLPPALGINRSLSNCGLINADEDHQFIGNDISVNWYAQMVM